MQSPTYTLKIPQAFVLDKDVPAQLSPSWPLWKWCKLDLMPGLRPSTKGQASYALPLLGTRSQHHPFLTFVALLSCCASQQGPVPLANESPEDSAARLMHPYSAFPSIHFNLSIVDEINTHFCTNTGNWGLKNPSSWSVHCAVSSGLREGSKFGAFVPKTLWLAHGVWSSTQCLHFTK